MLILLVQNFKRSFSLLVNVSQLLDEWQTADPDQMLHSAAYDLGLFCLLRHVCLNTWGRYSNYYNRLVTSNKYQNLFFINKKSAESDVAPAVIKSYKFLFVLKKIYFAVFKKLMGEFVRKMDKVENL